MTFWILLLGAGLVLQALWLATLWGRVELLGKAQLQLQRRELKRYNGRWSTHGDTD